ncbi:hypothetical protein [Streptomyces sp. NPDC057682]|uniref:hypothetical protein n=1 Tax=Streptomyces sp. NPDC057682 TaxID=3346210 RepID=UPI00369D649F
MGLSLDTSMVKDGSNGAKRRIRNRAETAVVTYQQASRPARPVVLEPARVIGITGDVVLTALVADGLGLSWARSGERVVVIRYEPVRMPNRRKLSVPLAPGAPQPVCAVDGADRLDRIEARTLRGQGIAEAVKSCRAAYDRVLLIAAFGSLPDLADVYVEVTQDNPVEPADVQWVIDGGQRAQRVLPRTPDQIAQHWCAFARRQTELRWPLLGHILIEPTHAMRAACHEYVWVTDEALARQHVQVLGRLPAPDRDPQWLRPIPVTDGRQAAAYDTAARTVRAALPQMRAEPAVASSDI